MRTPACYETLQIVVKYQGFVTQTSFAVNRDAGQPPLRHGRETVP